MKARDSLLAMTGEEQRDPAAQAWHREIGIIIKNTQALKNRELTNWTHQAGHAGTKTSN